ncbi:MULTISPECIES: metallophosphoesterase [Stenotrophomonas]|uniref:metallophosphoesterase n=1 Tax=Stenotrophomonas TaxID=40323 RepID=UPI001CF4DD5F|nr:MULTISPECIES: metallophosphoesterase [Stenotrophomonas]MCA7022434.1 metallophosphoesterase [Stenotrophomonas acidaminiphila]MCE4073991.1 metallophosphoesterase [Stenotrophomonas acidaminiphila]
MTLIVSLLLPLLALWLWWPVQFSGRRQRRWHLGASVALAVAGVGLAALWRMDVLAYAAEAWIQLVFGWVLAMFVMLLVWLALRELGWLLSRLAPRTSALATVWHGARANQAAAALIVLLATLGIVNGLKPPRVHERALVVPGLPQELDGLRMAVIADLHASPVKRTWRTRRVVDAVMATHPDLIVLPGDMVDGEVEDTAAFVAPLAELAAPHGVWVAPGNHEYYHGYRRWMAHFRGMGLGVLENQTARLDIGGRTLAVSGVGDLAALRPSAYTRGGLAPDLPAVIAAGKGSDAHILLAHQPKQARAAAATGAFDLQVSGHTHGGHMLGFDRWVVAPANHGYVRGDYRVGAMSLFVSSGAGQWDGFSVRLGVPSSIDVLVLKAGRLPGR